MQQITVYEYISKTSKIQFYFPIMSYKCGNPTRITCNFMKFKNMYSRSFIPQILFENSKSILIRLQIGHTQITIGHLMSKNCPQICPSSIMGHLFYNQSHNDEMSFLHRTKNYCKTSWKPHRISEPQQILTQRHNQVNHKRYS